ncbi:MAG: hypothetical protein ALAOOOJD_01064 [bacterium]|nr:hypothetical protein [bacterium]
MHQLRAPQFCHVPNDWPVVCVLPDQIRQDDEESQQKTKRKILGSHQLALRGAQQRQQERQNKKNDGVFIQESEPPENSQMQPRARILALQQLHDKISAQQPGKLIKSDRHEKRVAAQKRRRQNKRGASKPDGPGGAAKLFDEQCDHHNGSRPDHGRKKSGGKSRIAQYGGGKLAEHRRERRHGDVTPSGMIGQR